MIRALSGLDLGVPRIDAALVVEWADGPARVVFSYAQQGQAIAAHFACGKESLRSVKTAINAFCEWAFWAYEWCRMVMAVIGSPGVERIAQKCGFEHVADIYEFRVYARVRP